MMKRKYLSFILCVVFLFLIMVPFSYAESLPEEKAIEDSEAVLITGCEISDTLKKHISAAAENERIPVVIRIRDAVDLDAVEALAMERAGVTAAQLEEYEKQSYAAADTNEAKVQQALAREAYDKIRAERTAILSSYYRKLNTEFLEDAGLADAKYESISTLLPYIRGVQLTKAQIYTLANCGQVTYMDYYDNASCEEFASAAG